MVDRVKAAVDARTDAGFVIMARTDAAAVEGLDAAIERACAYVEAGADMIFPEAMKTLDDYRRFKAAVKVPILANLTEFGSTPFFTTDELRERERRHRAVLLRRVSRHEQGRAAFLRDRAPRRHAEEHHRHACRRAPSCTTSSATTPTKTSSTRCSRRPRQRNDDERQRPAPRPRPKKSVALSGTPAGNTALCTVGRSGNDLHYRGYDIKDLATKSTFEEVAHLLVHGTLPTASQLAAYKTKLKRLRGLPAIVAEALELVPANAHPMDVMRTGCSVLGTVLPERDDAPGSRSARHRRPR